MKNKSFLLIIMASLMTIILSIRSSGQFEIIFCDVGQGAATLLKLGNYQVLIDTGPDRGILSCIGRHLPYFDHTIEIVIISHNQKDHIGGLASLMRKYEIGLLYGPFSQPTDIQDGYFIEVKKSHKITLKKAKIFIDKASQSASEKVSLNDSALVVTIKTPRHTIFLPSDINGLLLKKLIPYETTILEVPHHGSKYGLYPDSLKLAVPSLAVISVGKRNAYGHPSKEVMDILKAKNISIHRTDSHGELVVPL